MKEKRVYPFVFLFLFFLLLGFNKLIALPESKGEKEMEERPSFSYTLVAPETIKVSGENDMLNLFLKDDQIEDEEKGTLKREKLSRCDGKFDLLLAKEPYYKIVYYAFYQGEKAG